MPPLNVMLMTRTLGHGGTERQLTEIALSLNRRLFTPHVGCVEGHGFRAAELRRRGVAILELPLTSFTSPQCLSSVVRLRRYLRQHRIALVHTFDTQMNVFGVPVAKLPGGPVVLSSQRCFENVIWPPHRKPTRIAHFLADGVVVNCQALERHLLEDYSVPARKIHICRNGLDTSVFAPGPAEQRRAERLRDAGLVIGTVCVLRPEKGIATLLEAFALMRGIRPGMRLVIVGSGPLREALEIRARELEIDGECLFCPATEDVASWLHAIDIFVLPSLSEAFSNSLMEAMACKCCAIASEVGGNPELVRHRETGLLFECGSAPDLANQLSLVALDDTLRDCLATAGAAWVAANLTRENAARRMEEIYLRQLGLQ
jgi:L-malate glycosyltransferase